LADCARGPGTRTLGFLFTDGAEIHVDVVKMVTVTDEVNLAYLME
jgi:hypothetical protein